MSKNVKLDTSLADYLQKSGLSLWHQKEAIVTDLQKDESVCIAFSDDNFLPIATAANCGCSGGNCSC